MPINDGHKIEPPANHPDVGDIDSPDMVGILVRDIAKKIGIDLVFQRPLAEVGPGWIPSIPISRMAV